MAEQSNFDVNMFTSPYQLTKSMRRDLYPAVEPTSPALSAQGKVIIITGAGGGLGAAIAMAWAIAGAAGIVLVGRSAKTLEHTATNVAKAGSSHLLLQTTDVVDEVSVKELFEKIKRNFGKAHVLVNTVGSMAQGMIGDNPLTTWWRDFETNVKGTFIPTQAFIQTFGAEGTIINLVSIAVAMSVPGISSYASSKLAVMKTTQSLVLEYPNLRAFSVHPGIVEAKDRGMVIDAFTPFAKDTQALTGGVSLWLNTPTADFLNGGFLSVNCTSKKPNAVLALLPLLMSNIGDVDELEAHSKEIIEGKLNQLGFLNGNLSPEGHPWASKLAWPNRKYQQKDCDIFQKLALAGMQRKTDP